MPTPTNFARRPAVPHQLLNHDVLLRGAQSTNATARASAGGLIGGSRVLSSAMGRSRQRLGWRSRGMGPLFFDHVPKPFFLAVVLAPPHGVGKVKDLGKVVGGAFIHPKTKATLPLKRFSEVAPKLPTSKAWQQPSKPWLPPTLRPAGMQQVAAVPRWRWG